MPGRPRQTPSVLLSVRRFAILEMSLLVLGPLLPGAEPTFAPYPVATPISSRRAILGFWLWAVAVALFIVGVILGIALYDVLPSDMGVNQSLTFPFVAAFIAIPMSTVGLGFAIASLVKHEPRRGLAITTIVLWPTTPIVALVVAHGVATLAS